jgi:predicted GIY-YIG superfamily endonuclease
MSRVFVLYRFFAADERLLYVGMTINPARRFEKHRGDKSWWSEVARIEVAHYPTLEALRVAERQAIKSEKPVHNIRMNGGNGSEPRPTAASVSGRRGIKVGSAYAFGLDDGECPVGLVIDTDDDGVTLTHYLWAIGVFGGNDDWIPYESIKRWRRAEVEHLKPNQRASDGFFYGREVKTLFLMDPLGDFQTRWTSAPAPTPTGVTP